MVPLEYKSANHSYLLLILLLVTVVTHPCIICIIGGLDKTKTFVSAEVDQVK